MSLFGDLPPPKRVAAPTKLDSTDLEKEYKPRALSPEDPQPEEERAGSADEEDGAQPDTKRRKTEGAGGASAGGGLSGDQVSAALVKIGGHIPNPDKFPKAAGLLRQLIDGGAAGRQHRELLFEVIKAAFTDLDAASDPGLRRDYMKLCHSLDKRIAAEPGLFSRAQRAQLEVYRLLGWTQNEMHTDDSFVFNKVLARIKGDVEALPPADEADEEAQAELQAADGDSDDGSDKEDDGRQAAGEQQQRETEHEAGAAAGGSGQAPAAAKAEPAEAEGGAPGPQLPQLQEQEEQAQEEQGAGAGARAGAGGDDVEADPFGLDSLLPAPKKKQAPPPPPPPPPAAAQARASAAAARGGGARGEEGGGEGRSNVWSAAQCLVMRRQAFIECLITAKSLHKLQWARTSVELLVEHFNKHRDRFTGQQQLAIDEMVRFVRDSRKARAAGPSVKELNRDTTSFERARSEWSRAKVSTRGKVGAQGDAKSNNWLG
ncbi:hypothetical protein HYH02_000398 [Chlamydomonas schloesseri]|uniref:Uncharacterized protein n=1 Tax=Chlamydomonas schloesseri TaxID=2026947 RepID=A0A836BCT6_9CHLO|nr:hypothetical protein HYH02_000398 [Chlamydomonas schloesseri]|eukprot:KAG2454553.1 hypothetical protein HYH02_000398 [Chlamydomonas schloesseri]